MPFLYWKMVPQFFYFDFGYGSEPHWHKIFTSSFFSVGLVVMFWICLSGCYLFVGWCLLGFVVVLIFLGGVGGNRRVVQQVRSILKMKRCSITKLPWRASFFHDNCGYFSIWELPGRIRTKWTRISLLPRNWKCFWFRVIYPAVKNLDFKVTWNRKTSRYNN